MAVEKEKSPSVRISQAAFAALEHLAKVTGKSKVALLDEALAAYEERLFWAGMDAGYERHGDAIRADMTDADGSLADGLAGIPV